MFFLVLIFVEGAPLSFLAGKDDFLFLRGKARDKSGLSYFYFEAINHSWNTGLVANPLYNASVVERCCWFDDFYLSLNHIFYFC